MKLVIAVILKLRSKLVMAVWSCR